MAMGLNPNTITAANSVLSLRCAGVFDDWIKITGAQSDAFASLDEVTTAQTQIGVDGKLSIGWVPHTTTATISLAANSQSISTFETIYNDFMNNMEVRVVELQLYYPSVKRKQTITGTLVRKSGGTGIGQLLTGHTYALEGISGGIEEVN
jgi:hypothetical protein